METNRKLTQDFKEAARKAGADLVGVAHPDRFDGAPKEMDPRYIFPDAKSVVVMGFRIPRGCFRGIEEGTYYAAYPVLGYWHINDVVGVGALRTSALFLEDHGYEGVPVPNAYLGPSIWYETGEKREAAFGSELGIRKDIYSGSRAAYRAVSPDKPMPDVTPHFRLAAVAAGLGEIGISKLFMSPQFGPRQRLALLITDAPLEPDPLFEGSVCDECMLCVNQCPGALSENDVVEVNVGGKNVRWHNIDVRTCRLSYAGGFPGNSPFVPRDYNWREKRDRDPVKAAFEIPYNASSIDKYHHLGAMEGAPCMRSCMDHLEKEKRIDATFHNPFRKRKPWRLEYDIK
jgi:hypothetical protein